MTVALTLPDLCADNLGLRSGASASQQSGQIKNYEALTLPRHVPIEDRVIPQLYGLLHKKLCHGKVELSRCRLCRDACVAQGNIIGWYEHVQSDGASTRVIGDLRFEEQALQDQLTDHVKNGGALQFESLLEG